MNFKNKFNKFRQYSEYFNDLNEQETVELLDSSVEKIKSADLSKETADICIEVSNSIKQSMKNGLNQKNINVKKLKKAFDELKDLNKSENQDKQTLDLMIGLIDLFIENNENMRNW